MNRQFKVGDTVMVLRELVAANPNTIVNWTRDMDAMVGLKLQVVSVQPNRKFAGEDIFSTVGIDHPTIPGIIYYFDVRWLLDVQGIQDVKKNLQRLLEGG